MTGKPIATVHKILSYQLVLIMCISLAFWLFKSGQDSISAALGGLAAFIPNAYLALKIQRNNSDNARKILNAFYTGEAVKLILTAALFVLIFQMPQLVIVPLLVGYIIALSVFWFALLLR